MATQKPVGLEYGPTGAAEEFMQLNQRNRHRGTTILGKTRAHFVIEALRLATIAPCRRCE